MATQVHKLHFILFPLMAPGHMIPMIDIAKLLANRGVITTIITTPVNANRFSSTITRAIKSGLRIQILTLKFPSVEVGLPEGCENIDMLPSLDLASKFFAAISMLKQQVENLLEGINPSPSCVISDMGFPWTTQIAQNFNIPRIVFHGTCCFSLLCSYKILSSNILENITSDSEYFVVPDLPDRVELTKAQVSGSTKNTTSVSSSVLKEVTEQIRLAEESSYGVIVNSFEELEQVYEKEYRKARGKKVWCVGPVSLCNKEIEDLVTRGNKTAIDNQDCLKWLDNFETESVVYASLGSLSRLTLLQMVELGLGLEESNRPFVWVLGGGDKLNDLEKWILENGFEQRIKERGVLIRGWAPQVLILSHPAIGGVLTHCGWNSTLEGISAGLPMVTWPLFAEQFCNEKLVVQVLKIGVSLGVKVPVKWGDEENVGVLVKKDDVKKALDKLMDEGEEGQVRRTKAKELGELAKKAFGEGGSSYVNLTSLIEDIIEQQNHKEK
ncbi:UDP-glycosyltransferase 73C3-like [Nicotiana tabacum]|uniref:Glycosyltransferase n=1 Tax=Nicotiana tabacum TaxID=4097 RepID=Q589Y3_TOBAC|nr:UDP-glycosyltransferase 73C3-like [Nicotiana tabacum]XP_009623864.1 UDP-glycosyltransferase 73C3-like [Nicotiana tomentosiformis]BAD93688.1 glucosyltransferase [Nicotiana tabacum]